MYRDFQDENTQKGLYTSKKIASSGIDSSLMTGPYVCLTHARASISRSIIQHLEERSRKGGRGKRGGRVLHQFKRMTDRAGASNVMLLGTYGSNILGTYGSNILAK